MDGPRIARGGWAECLEARGEGGGFCFFVFKAVDCILFRIQHGGIPWIERQ